jgi:tripartite-type tricarboxylate transporter receptor subunit TctC
MSFAWAGVWIRRWRGLMFLNHRGFLGLVVVSALALAGCGRDVAEGDTGAGGDSGSPLEGETVEFIVPADPGGGFDTFARTLAPYLEEASGATVVVKNEPGAGTLLASNNTYRAGEDELRIQIFDGLGSTAADVIDLEGAQFEMDKFSWIGRIFTEPQLVAAAEGGRYPTFQDVLDSDEQLRWVAAGPGTPPYINAMVVSAIFDLDSRVITGFGGGPEGFAAVRRGEADLASRGMGGALLEEEGVLPLMVLTKGEERLEVAPDVPVIKEFPQAQQATELLEAHLSLLEAGRPIAASPNMPEETVEALREAFAEATADEKYLDELKTLTGGLDASALDGAATQELFAELVNVPESYRQVLADAYAGS